MRKNIEKQEAKTLRKNLNNLKKFARYLDWYIEYLETETTADGFDIAEVVNEKEFILKKNRADMTPEEISRWKEFPFIWD